MTRHLILMRHAKSDWDAPVATDHDRPLNARGRRAAAIMGDWLRAREVRPDLALVSTAHRTEETFTRLRLDCPVEFDARLYHASPDLMFRRIAAQSAATLLLIGHNPGIAELAAGLCAVLPTHPRFEDFPTGATLILTFDHSDWSGLAWGSGRPVDFAIPREVEEAG